MLGSIDGSRKERHQSQAHNTCWVQKRVQKHWCLPPRWYPQPERKDHGQLGPGSVWECPSCSLKWTSFGIWLDNDPDNWPRGDMNIKPLFAVGRWRVVGEERTSCLARERFGSEREQKAMAAHIETQEDSYDWRGIALLSNKFLRRQIELQGGTWRDILD